MLQAVTIHSIFGILISKNICINYCLVLLFYLLWKLWFQYDGKFWEVSVVFILNLLPCMLFGKINHSLQNFSSEMVTIQWLQNGS